MKVDFTISGWKEIDAELAKMSERAEVKTLVAAGRAGAGLVRKKLKRRLPKGPSKPFYIRGKKYERKHLANSMGVVKKRGSRNTAEVHLGYRGQANFYGHVVEFGNSTQEGTHDWEETFDSSQQEIISAMGKKLKAEILRRNLKGLDQE